MVLGELLQNIDRDKAIEYALSMNENLEYEHNTLLAAYNEEFSLLTTLPFDKKEKNNLLYVYLIQEDNTHSQHLETCCINKEQNVTFGLELADIKDFISWEIKIEENALNFIEKDLNIIAGAILWEIIFSYFDRHIMDTEIKKVKDLTI